jgi:hypothetical protein
MRHLALAIALACVLSGLARAGEIHTTGAVAPPPPGTSTTTAGEIHSTGVETTQDSVTVVTIILTLIEIVP